MIHIRSSSSAELLIVCLVTMVITAALAPALRADQPPEARPTADDDVLSSLLEPSSALLINVDLPKITLQPIIDWAVESGLIAEDAKPPQQVVGLASTFIDAMKSAGAEQLYLSVATRSLHDGGPLLIIPCEDAGSVEKLVTGLISMAGADEVLQVHSRDALVLVGPAKVLDRVTAAEKARPEPRRDDLIGALGDPERKDHLAVLALADMDRDELIAIWPAAWPHSAIELSPRQLVQDIRRVSITWNLPPEPAIKIQAQTTDAAATDRVEQFVQNALAQLSGALFRERETNNNWFTTDRGEDVVSVALDSAAIEKLLDRSGALQDAAAGRRTANDLKQVGLAMYNYHDVHRHLPPKYFVDPEHRPLFSWRVAILPFIEQVALYNSVRLDQPWNAPDNAFVSVVAVPTYSDHFGDQPVKTRLRLPVFPGSAWDGEGEPKTLPDITDGTVNTIAVIHAPAEAAVAWADPAQWKISAEDPMKDIFADRDEVLVLFFDGSVQSLRRDELDNKKLSALLTIAGGEPISR